MDQNNLQRIACILKLQQIALKSLLHIKLLKRLRKTLRRWWVKPYLLPEIRNAVGAYTTLCLFFELNDHEEFERHFRMSVDKFEHLNRLVGESLTKIYWKRTPIPSVIRLALTLHYLGHGGSVRVNSFMYRVGNSTYYNIIVETCKAISKILIPLYLQLPNQEEWLRIAKTFDDKWNFPNCIGSLDGKHMRIKRPPHGGSVFFNYKRFHSIVLMAISDANCKFIWFTLGDSGSFNDASVFNNSNFYKKLTNNQLQIPGPKNLSNSNRLCSYVFVADEIFGISTNLMKPYNRKFLHDMKHQVFNYRLSRARFTIESAFGILCSKWQLLNSALGFNLTSINYIISACLCLHNFLKSENIQDLQDDVINELQEQNNHDIVRNPEIIRQNFTEYFVNEGAVAWQNNYIANNFQNV